MEEVIEATVGRRTGLDFKDHELTITEQEGLLVHLLKRPNTTNQHIKFINTNGILAVTGDYGNWIFCREFHPSASNQVSDGYWLEKLSIASTQEGEEFDSEATREVIQRGLDGELEEWGYKGKGLEEIREYYEGLLEYCDYSQWEYEAFAYSNIPSDMCSEDVPMEKKVKIWLQHVYDGFEEICRRVKDGGFLYTGPPTFIKMWDTAMRLYEGRYHRDAGNWGVDYDIIDGRLFSKSSDTHLNGVELFPITYDEWKKDNGGWLPYGVSENYDPNKKKQ